MPVEVIVEHVIWNILEAALVCCGSRGCLSVSSGLALVSQGTMCCSAAKQCSLNLMISDSHHEIQVHRKSRESLAFRTPQCESRHV